MTNALPYLALAFFFGICNSAKQAAYEKAVDTHGLVFTAPKDSSDAMWKRALEWFDRDDVHEQIATATQDAIQSRPAVSAGDAQYSVSRLAFGDSVRYIVTFDFKAGKSDYGKSNVMVPYTARKFAYWIHYAIDYKNFPEPSPAN